MESVFECTLDMISKDFHEYPEHRVQFFKLLQAINLYCFPALLKLDTAQFKFVIDSCMWASKHDNREVENTGLAMCLELMNNMAETDAQTSSIFFRQFYVPILQDVLFVLTDSDHKAGMQLPSLLCTDTHLDLQVSNRRPCFCRACFILLNLEKFRAQSTLLSKHLRAHLIRSSCKNMSPIFYKMPLRISKSELLPRSALYRMILNMA